MYRNPHRRNRTIKLGIRPGEGALRGSYWSSESNWSMPVSRRDAKTRRRKGSKSPPRFLRHARCGGDVRAVVRISIFDQRAAREITTAASSRTPHFRTLLFANSGMNAKGIRTRSPGLATKGPTLGGHQEGPNPIGVSTRRSCAIDVISQPLRGWVCLCGRFPRVVPRCGPTLGFETQSLRD